MRYFVLFTLLTVISAFALAQHPAYFRQPALASQTLIFTSEGDLWVNQLADGEARRLTSHPGEEVWPVLSPDGATVAFQAEYDGARDVFVMPVDGGTPQRISWLSGRPVAWTPQGDVIVRTGARSGLPQSRLVTINPQTKEIAEVPLAEAAEAAMTKDGTLFFARLARQGSNSRWYKGGTAQQLWRFQEGDAEATPLTKDYPGASRQPTLLDDGRLYFLSDRQDAMNVWSMLPDGTDLQRHTDYRNFDVQELTGSGQTLVFRMAADLYRLEVPSGKPVKLTIALRSDMGQTLTDYETKPLDRLGGYALSHKGEHVALVSRGQLFVAPKGAGRLVHADPNSGVRYRGVAFGPDSSIVYALSDSSGELEWWEVPVDGIGQAKRLTDGPAILRQSGVVSPKGRYLAHSNYLDGLWLVDLKTGDTRRVADESFGSDVTWSPDGRYLVYPRAVTTFRAALYAYDTEEQRVLQLTDGNFDDGQPEFSDDGNWLFFVSSRHWNSTVGSPWGERAPQPHFEKTRGLYALPLREGARWPFTPDNELLADLKEDTAKQKAPLRFDLVDQLRRVPVAPNGFGGLVVAKKRLLYSVKDKLFALDFKPEAEPVEVASDVSGFELSGDRSSLLLHKRKKGKGLYVLKADAGKNADFSKAKVRLDGWRFAVDKRAEWNQIYAETWRLHRDYFWDKDMHGVDWGAMRQKYQPLLQRVGSRNELNDVIGQLISELSLLHSNARGGDVWRPDPNIQVGQLGGVFARDEASGGFRLERKFEGHPNLPDTWGPLQQPDSYMALGEVILSVNGHSAKTAPQLEALLVDQVGKHVLLGIRNVAGDERQVLAKAISPREAYALRYEDWERERLRLVDSLSDSDIGYVHVQTMGTRDIGRWTRDFYSQLDKKALVIDVRHNFGGNIDSWLLSQLMRRAWSYFTARTDAAPYPNMQESFNGKLVVLTDHWTASDGEAFADGFKRLGLGHTIGTRTWGGEVWLTSSNRQVDGGIARASEFGVFDLEGNWLIEGWGFVPDEEVENLPHASYLGQDAQLEAAVRHLREELKRDPLPVIRRPAYPVVKYGQGFPTPYPGWKE